MTTAIDIIEELVNLGIDVTLKQMMGKFVADLNTGAKSGLYMEMKQSDPSKITLYGRYDYINQDLNIYDFTTVNDLINDLVDIVLYECVSSSGFISHSWLHLAKGYDKVLPDCVLRYLNEQKY